MLNDIIFLEKERLYKGILNLVLVMKMRTKAIYEEGILKLLGKLNLEQGEEVEIEVPISVVERTYAVSKLSDEIIEEIIETTESGE